MFYFAGFDFFLLVVVLPLVCCQVFHSRISIHTDPPLSAKQRSPAKVVSPPHDKNPSHSSIPMLDFQPGLTQHSTTPGLFKKKKISGVLEKGLLLSAEVAGGKSVRALPPCQQQDFGEGVVAGESQSWCSASPSHVVCVLVGNKLLDLFQPFGDAALCVVTSGEVGSRPGCGWMLFPRGFPTQGGFSRSFGASWGFSSFLFPQDEGNI